MGIPNEFQMYAKIVEALRQMTPDARERLVRALVEEVGLSIGERKLPGALPPGTYNTKIIGATPVPGGIRVETEVQPAPGQMMSVEDAAALAGVSRQAMYVAVRRGKVAKAPRKRGEQIRIARADALAYRTHARALTPRSKSRSRSGK